MEKKKIEKSTLVVICLIAAVIIAVVGYGIYSSQQEGESPTPAPSASQITGSQTTSQPQQFTTPDFVKKYTNLNLKEHFGYIPKEDYWANGGKFYQIDGYILGYDPYSDFSKPVHVSAALSALFPGKEEYTYAEIKEKVGDKLSELNIDEANGSGYWCQFTHDGYTYYLQSDNTTFSSVMIYLDYEY